MPNYAVIKNSIVENVIIADSEEIAELVTGLKVLETNGQPWIGWQLYDNKWRPPIPQTEGLWVWDEDEKKWTQPE